MVQIRNLSLNIIYLIGKAIITKKYYYIKSCNTFISHIYHDNLNLNLLSSYSFIFLFFYFYRYYYFLF